MRSVSELVAGIPELDGELDWLEFDEFVCWFFNIE
jgi:hypothetical protein